jgi:hypothetical protein
MTAPAKAILAAFFPEMMSAVRFDPVMNGAVLSLVGPRETHFLAAGFSKRSA